MIATNIGRTFLKAFNEKTGNNYTAKEFFEKEFFDYYFNHSKYFMWPTNSPFVQGVTTFKNGHLGIMQVVKDTEGDTLQFETDEALEEYAEKLMKEPDFGLFKVKTKKQIKVVRRLSEAKRKSILEEFNNKVQEAIINNNVEASVAIGFSASEIKEFATTSGSITDINLLYNEDDIYLSWIGGGLGVGIASGYSIFFDNADILLKLYDGWKVYRSYLNDNTLDRIRGNQINTWNGQWLNYSFSRDYRDYFDFNRLSNQGVFSVTEKNIEVNTINWSELFFNISNIFPNQTLTGYVYSIGQTNKTLGFYPFHFSKARKLIRYYQLLFGENAAINEAKDYEALFGIHIKRACELGSIGLQALEPKNIRKYFGNETNLKLIKPVIKQKGSETNEEFDTRKSRAQKKDYENIVTYRTYKTWLFAMITKNKEESLEYTSEVAKALLVYREGAKKNDRKNTIQLNLLGAKSKKAFIDALVTIISDVDEDILPIIKQLRDRVHLMSSEDFGYFIVLLKFDYAYEERNL